MGICKAKEAKKQLENEITELLYQFTLQTGLTVEHVDVNYPDIRKMIGEKIIVYRVEVEAKL